jgi:hypothetical protein
LDKIKKHKKIIKNRKLKEFDPSKLIEEIGKLTVKIQTIQKEMEKLSERLAMKEGHIREKENKLNMIRSIVNAGNNEK